jgi:hypothetical protein
MMHGSFAPCDGWTASYTFRTNTSRGKRTFWMRPT